MRSLCCGPRAALFLALGVLGLSGCDDDGGGATDASVAPEPDLFAVAAPYGLDTRPANPTCVAPARPPETGAVKRQDSFPNLSFSLPIAMVQPASDSSIWYLVQKGGKVVSFANDETTSSVKTVVDITSKVNSGPNEAGLLGIALHPQFATNHYLYLSYTAYTDVGAKTGLRSTVSRFTVREDGTADANAETKIFPLDDASPNLFDQPYENHNGGNLAFGPDGFLYFAMGDGGDAGDPQNRSQNLTLPFGKMMRVDVDNIPSGKRHGIPADNPFAGGGGLAEIYAWGFRNPWRWSFDRGTGELWVGDVGQDTYEEVDRVDKGGNYGWRLREGFHCFNPATNCPTAGLIDPIVEYDHSIGNSITGGYVYRGSAIPSLVGTYVYTDEGNGKVFAIEYDQDGKAQHTDLIGGGINPSSMAEGNDGELYFLSYVDGTIKKLVPNGDPPVDTFPKKLSQTGCVDPTDATRPAAGVIPYGVNVALWSDGAAKDRWLALPDGTQIAVGADGDWDFPIGTVLMKRFSLGGKPVETRLLIRHADGGWAGYSYEWNDAGTDADLLPAGKSKAVAGQTWTYPSRSDCLRCHTVAAGRSLGLETAQQNGDLVYYDEQGQARRSNQLATLDHIGLFAQGLGDPAALPRLPTIDGDGDALEARARAYLHANCSNCHRPNGTGQGPADFRFSTAFADTHSCNQEPQEGTLGVDGAKLIVPGDPARSVLSLRTHALDANRMPPLGSKVVDATGTALLDQWITSLTACP